MKKLALIGNPVSHSLSPKIHNFISNRIGSDYEYEAIETPSGELCNVVDKLRRNFCGFNVTKPYKRDVVQYLDYISDDAKLVGAVNTVVNRDGKLFGYNTDGEGFYSSLLYNGINPKGADILVLGAGGAARPVIVRLANAGIKSLTIKNRTPEKIEQCRKIVLESNGFLINAEPNLKHYDIVINCTPLGMGENKGVMPTDDISVIDANTAVCDMIYNPWETEFLKRARHLGAKTVNGIGMLVFQAIPAYELFTGITLPENIADLIFDDIL